VRDSLEQLFNGKCAYCERPGATIDHFRPKWRANRLGGRIDPDHYWWLTAEWTNLYACCVECNARKANAFPIDGAPAAPRTFGRQLQEELPLLLDPCEDRPENHLRFMASGMVLPLTRRGEATISLFDLNHRFLVSAREASARRALQDCERHWAYLTPAERNIVDFREKVLAHTFSTDYVAVIRLVVEDFIQSHFDAAPSTEPAVSNTLPASDLELDKAVWLDAIEIRNFKSIDTLAISFPPLEEADPDTQDVGEDDALDGEAGSQPWMMVLGENGVGKSSLLQAIALALMPDAERDKIGRASLWLRRHHGVKAGHVRLAFSDGSERLLKFDSKSKHFTVKGDCPSMPVLAYGSTRLLPRRNSKVGSPAAVSVRNLFDHMHPLSNTERYLCDLEAVSEAHFQILAGSLKSMLPISEDTELQRKGTQLSAHLAGRRTRLSELSDGYKSMLALAMDIMFHLTNSSFDMESARGLVMIDELELHLHPRWKVAVVRQLRTLFPNVRFVATTHDPLCVLGLRRSELHVLTADPTTRGIILEKIDVPRGTRADEVLTGPWFGVSSTIDAATQALMQEHSRLLQRQERTRDEESRRTELEEVLCKRLAGFATTRAQRAVLAAAAVLNPGRPESHLDHVLQHRLAGLIDRDAATRGGQEGA